MKISVIIPYYNQFDYLKFAIDSVLSQSLNAYEIILVDNNSDEPEKLMNLINVRGNKIKLLSQNKQGASAARNLGIEQAQGDYIAFLDADDWWHFKKLELQMHEIQKYPKRLIFTKVQNFLSPEIPVENARSLYFSKEPLDGITPSSLLLSRQNLKTVGYFNESIQTGEFIEWYIRAQQLGLVAQMIPDTLVYRRVHLGHIGKSNSHAAYLKILHQKLQFAKTAS